MTVEFIGEKIFLQEVEADGKVWVARGEHQNIYALELDESGYSLPVWSDRERVVEYLHNARLVLAKFEPYPVPLDLFTQAWLSNQMMEISELLVNMDGVHDRTLVLTIEEFVASQDPKKVH
ncbi:DUF2750 domain-containing protein [Geomonas sp.]|uniref:DUF2750 domain-containing protein n=1 Tax=Geomonas sp. TaxID=2651584 RepID=UPI002B4A4716|nr:DUF2750 domain-containing protein [Geomonas sp.]HJV35739.1 DUF2750 domain-containing protein [Geomonas sp.]